MFEWIVLNFESESDLWIAFFFFSEPVFCYVLFSRCQIVYQFIYFLLILLFVFKYVVCVTTGRLLSCLIGFPAYSSIWFCLLCLLFYLDVFCCGVFMEIRLNLNVNLKESNYLSPILSTGAAQTGTKKYPNLS